MNAINPKRDDEKLTAAQRRRPDPEVNLPERGQADIMGAGGYDRDTAREIYIAHCQCVPQEGKPAAI